MTTDTTTTPPTTPVPSCGTCGGPVPPKPVGKPGPARTTCDACKQDKARARGRRRYEKERAARAAKPKGPRLLKHNPGDRFGSLVIVERPKDHALAVFRCDCGRTVEKTLKNVTRGRTRNCADRSRHAHPLRVERPTYNAAHRRVQHDRGPASGQPCTGCQGEAIHWAYDHADHDQLTEQTGRERGFVYSAEPGHYFPLCRRCHRNWDRARAKAAPRHHLSLAHIALGAL